MSATTIESSRAAERPDTIGVVLVDDHAIEIGRAHV